VDEVYGLEVGKSPSVQQLVLQHPGGSTAVMALQHHSTQLGMLLWQDQSVCEQPFFIYAQRHIQ
jgi:hypothetical protein